MKLIFLCIALFIVLGLLRKEHMCVQYIQPKYIEPIYEEYWYETLDEQRRRVFVDYIKTALDQFNSQGHRFHFIEVIRLYNAGYLWRADIMVSDILLRASARLVLDFTVDEKRQFPSKFAP